MPTSKLSLSQPTLCMCWEQLTFQMSASNKGPVLRAYSASVAFGLFQYTVLFCQKIK